MPPALDGVQKTTGFYQKSIKRLQAVVEEKLRQLANLEHQRALRSEREQVLVDLVLQQEHHLEHLNKVKASLDEELASLDELLSICDVPAPKPSAPSAPGGMCISTSSSAAPNPTVRRIDQTASGIFCDKSQTSAFVQSYQQLLQHPQEQAQDAVLQASQQQVWRQDSLSQAMPLLEAHIQPLGIHSGHCNSDPSCSPLGSCCSNSVQSNSNRPQYVQSLMQAASFHDWERAMTMTTDDWCSYFMNVATRLKTVMALRDSKRQAAGLVPMDSKKQSRQVQQLDSQFFEVLPAKRAAIVEMSLRPGGPPVNFVDPDVEMVALVDDFNTVVNLAVLHNPMPVRDCARRNTSTREYQDVVPLSFWAEATARTGLSQEQMQHLRFGYNEYWRILGQVHNKQQQLACSVEVSTSASAPTPWGLKQGISHAAAAAAATVPAQQRDNLLQLLDEHMARWQTAAQLLLQFYINTMTHEQTAQMLIACCPYFPRMGSLIGAVAEVNQPGAFQQLEDQMQQLRAQHAQAAVRRKLQLEKQRLEYWRRLVVLREQQQEQALQRLQLQPRFVLQPLTLPLQQTVRFEAACPT